MDDIAWQPVDPKSNPMPTGDGSILPPQIPLPVEIRKYVIPAKLAAKELGFQTPEIVSFFNELSMLRGQEFHDLARALLEKASNLLRKDPKQITLDEIRALVEAGKI
jgi:hypothetical protein